MIDLISQKFETRKKEKVDPPTIAAAAPAQRMRSIDSERAANDPPTALAVITVTCCRPWCPRCRSWQGRETLWSDGSNTIRCRCCGVAMPDWPNTDQVDKEAKTDKQTSNQGEIQ